jgi:FMN-dependent oxidoreductase (nitrilotriacetate monooxygenase family)
MGMFHLGWFLGPGITIQGWNEPGFSPGYDWTKPDIFVDAARALERACFDVFILEDSSAVPYAYQGKMDFYLKNAVMTPKFDPVMLTPYLIAATKHIGLAPTLTSTFYPPWLLARSLGTLDHFSSGRIAWNIVTATSDAAAQNYGLDMQIEHDLRYDMADEYVECVSQLWDAWAPDAVVMDEGTHTFIDPSKVKVVDFKGKYYKTRGPLNIPRSPQGRPVFIAPGGSPRGRQFAGRNAEIVLAGGESIADMKGYRDDVMAHAKDLGRDTSKIKTLFTCVPTVVKSPSDVADTKDQLAKARAHHFERGLAAMSFLSGLDFSKFDPDKPMGEFTTNGMQTLLRTFKNAGPNATLRDVVTKPNGQGFTHFVGTADQIAGQMQESMEEIGGDGFLITGHLKPKYIQSVTDELVPALWKRQLTRREYSNAHLRDNVTAF